MNKYIKYSFIYILFLTLSVTSANAVKVKDNKGIFSIDYTPKKIVVLEYSFVDALALIGVSPIGIADDNDKNRIIPSLLSEIREWTSVGTLSQPNLEIIASLKPDLIIADIKRHEGIYESLKKIAPTIILPSRRCTYKESFDINMKIAKVLGKSKEMKIRLNKHNQYIENIKKYIPEDLEIQFSTAKEKTFFINTEDTYIAEVIRTLGIKYPKSNKDKDAPRYASLEQLLYINPQYLIVGASTELNIIDKWKKKPLWKLLKCSKKGHLIYVDRTLWSRSRGIIATEQIAKDIVAIFGE